MNDAPATEVGAWVTAAGLAGATEPDLLHGFCERAVAAGLPLARAIVLIDTLHPVHEGRVFHWSRDPVPDERTVVEYGRTIEWKRARGELASQPVLPPARNRRVGVAAPPRP
jgi:adenylate cyclase